MSGQPIFDQRRPDQRRQARERAGVWAEIAAAACLLLKGHWILARRHRTPFGEIDLIARRGRRLTFVEVKQRQSLIEAESALEAMHGDRFALAVEHWLSRHVRHRDLDVHLDAMIVLPWRWPIHCVAAMRM
jgi:putative endonuclease